MIRLGRCPWASPDILGILGVSFFVDDFMAKDVNRHLTGPAIDWKCSSRLGSHPFDRSRAISECHPLMGHE